MPDRRCIGRHSTAVDREERPAIETPAPATGGRRQAEMRASMDQRPSCQEETRPSSARDTAARATTTLSQLLAATAGQQGREQQDKDDTEQKRHRAQPSPKPTTMASQKMSQRMMRDPRLQIETTTTRSSWIPSSLIPMTRSKRDRKT
jgi:hypothetical protein